MVTFDLTAAAMDGRDTTEIGLWRAGFRGITLQEKRCSRFCGVHWLVRSQEVEIQARYSDERTWVKNLAISGAFLQNHTLIISADDETVNWDGAIVLNSFPASFSNELVNLQYANHQHRQSMRDTHRPEDGAGRRRRRSIVVLKTMQVDLPQQVSLVVSFGGAHRGRLRFLDAFITLPIPVGGVDGHCGNANGDVSDDTKDYFNEHLSTWRVPAQDSLFTQQLLALESTEISTAASGDESEVDSGCEVGTSQEAMTLCLDVMPNDTSTDWLDACAVDVCAGGESMANRTLALAMQAEQTLELESQRATGSCHTCTPDEPCFEDVKWAMEIGIATGYYEDQDLNLTLDNSSCFENVQDALHALSNDPDRAGNSSMSSVAACSANPGCSGLVGDCCPAPDGMMLACCTQQPVVATRRHISEGSVPVACPSLLGRHEMHNLTYCR